MMAQYELTNVETDETIATYDVYAAGYAALNDSYKNERLMRFADLIGDGLILDAGCGTGRDANEFKNRGCKVLALDLSAQMARLTCDRGVPAVQGDLRSLPFGDESVSGVWMNASLLHVPRIFAGEVVGEAARILVSGGLINLEVKEGEGTTFDRTPAGRRHFTMFSELEVLDLLRRAGFGSCEVDPEKADCGGRANVTWIRVRARKL
jgi:ubiquinone/menaquinone biosynthesis C-methylase UbiE